MFDDVRYNKLTAPGNSNSCKRGHGLIIRRDVNVIDYKVQHLLRMLLSGACRTISEKQRSLMGRSATHFPFI